MRKTVFVEGQTELIFVKNLLLNLYRWDSSALGFDCLQLRHRTSFPYSEGMSKFGSMQSANYFQIIDCGSDTAVNSKARENAERLKNAGYSLVLGLRDVYGDSYNLPEIDAEEIRKIINGSNEVFAKLGIGDFVRIHFAVMEVEAWLIALETPSETFSLETDNRYKHPAKKIEEVIKQKYSKSASQVESITAKYTKEDYQHLYDSNRCPSFNAFLDSLLSAI